MTAPDIGPNYSKTIQLSVFCALIAALVVSYLWFNKPTEKNPSATLTPSPTTSQMAQKCISTDKSFCTTETKFENLVKISDYSDILENETARPVSCQGTQVSASYCTGVSSSLPIDTYELIENNHSIYLSRNQFIQTLMNYVSSFGAPHLTSDRPNSQSMTMIFATNSSSHPLSLQFEKADGAWKLVSPQIN